MAKVAQLGSFRSIKTYGLTDVGSYLRSLREAKQKLEDNYWEAALENGSEDPEDILAYWEGQRDRFAPGTIEYKSYKAKIEGIKTTIDVNKVSALVAENKYEEAVNYYQTTVLPKYDKDSPAYSEAFVQLQKLKEAKISYDITLQDAKLRAKYSPGGLSGRNLANYFAEMIKYLENEGLNDRAEYFDYVAKYGDAIESVAEQEKAKERSAFNKRLNELIGEKEGAITSSDWVGIYTQLTKEFPKGGEGYATALEGLTKAQEVLRADEEKTRKQEVNILMNSVLSKYAQGGIDDREYAQALQEMLTMLPPGSEEANEIARTLGNLQETLGARYGAETKEAEVKKLMESITALEAQEQYQKTQFMSGLISGSEYDKWRTEFLEKASPLYSNLGQYSNDWGVWQKVSEYQSELQRMPERAEQRSRGELIDIVATDPKTGMMTINTVNLKSLDPASVPAEGLNVITDKGIETIFYNMTRGSWTSSEGIEFAKPPTTKEIRDAYALPAGLSDIEAKKRIEAFKSAEASGAEFSPQSILGVATEAKSPFEINLQPFVSKVAEVARKPYETLYGRAPSVAGIKLPEFKLPEFKMPELNLPTFSLPTFSFDYEAERKRLDEQLKKITSGISSTVSGVGDWLGSTVGQAKSTLSNLWGGLTSGISSALSKLKFW